MTQLKTKIMMLGEIGVGKTSIVRRLVFNTFEFSYKATIGVDIYSYTLSADETRLKQDLDLFIWDVDGDLGASIFTHIYMKGAAGACIVSDATRPPTYKTALGLAEGFEQNLPGRPALMLLNKIDLLSADRPPALSLAPTVGLETVMTSAATGHRVLDAFINLGRRCVESGYAS